MRYAFYLVFFVVNLMWSTIVSADLFDPTKDETEQWLRSHLFEDIFKTEDLKIEYTFEQVSDCKIIYSIEGSNGVSRRVEIYFLGDVNIIDTEANQAT